MTRPIADLRADYAAFCEIHGHPATRDRRYLADELMEALEAYWRVVEAAREVSAEMLKRGSAPCTLEQEWKLRDALAALDSP
jgi:hypothetical protein